MRRSRQRAVAASLAPMALLVLAPGCGERPRSDLHASPETASSPTPVFRDISATSGVEFTHFTGATGRFYFPEIMGSGVALIDYDGDGDLDLYLLQGAPVAGAGLTDALFPPASPPVNRLYRNDLLVTEEGPSTVAFTDVTLTSGTGDPGHAMGVAVGDFDGDGDADLYVTNYGANVLYRNNSDGTFTDVTSAAGVGDSRWSTSATFLDYDLDGDLDLFHANYVAFAEDVERVCRRPSGEPDYCTPLAYRPLPDTLYRNEGSGRFTDVTTASGVASTFGNGLGVVTADFDGDARPDIFVANDGVANQLWLNRGDGTFTESALASGVAFNEGGEPEAGMGVAVGDLEADGDVDLFLSHLVGESNTLYLNQGHGDFIDRTATSALASASRGMTGFGTQLVDFDADGLLDIMVVNGAVTKVASQLGDAYPYMMPNQLFRGEAPTRFVKLPGVGDQALGRLESSRGLTVGDLDLDGTPDLVLTNNNGPARVLRNEVGASSHWLTVAADGRFRAPLRLTVQAPGLRRQVRHPHTDGSYCSARDEQAYFGLADHSAPLDLRADWRDGRRVSWRRLPPNRRILVSPTPWGGSTQ